MFSPSVFHKGWFGYGPWVPPKGSFSPPSGACCKGLGLGLGLAAGRLIGLLGFAIGFLGLRAIEKLALREFENVVVEQVNRSTPPAARTQELSQRRIWIDARAHGWQAS